MTEKRVFGRAIESLDRQLAATANVVSHRQLRVQKAGVLARLGRTTDARQLVVQLRQENMAYEPRLSAWIMYTEGLIEHFESLDVSAARDRFRRGYAVAIASGDQELRAICAAWLADSDFRLANIESSIGHLKQAFQSSSSASHEARGRSCLVLADLMSWAGLHDQAKSWYRRARDHAVALGEIGMQSVVLFNSVSFRVAALVLQDCFSNVQADSTSALQREVASVANLDIGLGISTLATMVPALQAELNTVQRNWNEAINLFDGFLGNLDNDGQGRLNAKFLAQRAWCMANLGRPTEAEESAKAARTSIENCPDLDDLAVVYARLAATFKSLGKSAKASAHRATADRCITAYHASQSQLQAAIRDALVSIQGHDEENPATGRV